MRQKLKACSKMGRRWSDQFHRENVYEKLVSISRSYIERVNKIKEIKGGLLIFVISVIGERNGKPGC